MNPPSLPFPPPLPPSELAEQPLPQVLDTKTLFEALLRRPKALVLRLLQPDHGATWKFATMALVSFLLFGFVLGCFAKHEQFWAAPLKIVAGLVFSGVICFPSLYIFSTLSGARISVAQMSACFCGALALAGLLLLGFAPAIWIFAESTDSFGFMGSLAVAAWLVGLFFAIPFLNALVVSTGGNQKGPLLIWCCIFLLVTLQMTTSLRPILGRSDELLTSEKKFFLQHWTDTAGYSLTSPEAKTSSSTATPPPEAPENGARNPFNEN